MQIRLLGTGSAEGIPAFYSESRVSAYAREHGGKDVRTRSAALINEVLKIDLPPDTLGQINRDRLDARHWEALLFTHGDDDHFAPRELQYGVYPFNDRLYLEFPIFGNDKVVSRLHFLYPDWPFEVQLIRPFCAFEAAGHRVTPVKANHNHKEECLNHIIQRDEKTMLYATDTGYWSEETWEFLEDFRLDVLVIECTDGFVKSGYEGHLDIETCIKVVDRLRAEGALGDFSRVITTHHSHLGNATHGELTSALSPHRIEPGYDGMIIDFRGFYRDSGVPNYAKGVAGDGQDGHFLPCKATMASFTRASIEPPPESYRIALDHFDEGQFLDAAHAFDELVTRGDGVRMVRLARFYASESYAAAARQSLMEQDFAPSAELFRKALGYSPNFPDLHLGLARSLAGLGQFEGAEKEVLEALRLHEGYLDAILSHAALNVLASRLEEAIDALDAALLLDPTLHSQVDTLRGELTRMQNRDALFEKIWGLRSPSQQAIRDRLKEASAAHQNLRFEHAIEGYRAVLSMCPSYPDVHFRLARAAKDSDQLELAEKHLREALSINPRFVVALSLLGILLMEGGREIEGSEFIERALELDPYHPFALERAAAMMDRRSSR